MIVERSAEYPDYIYIEADCKIRLMLSYPEEVAKLYAASISDQKKDPDYAMKQIAAKNALYDHFKEEEIKPEDILQCIVSGKFIKDAVKICDPGSLAEDTGNVKFADVKM